MINNKILEGIKKAYNKNINVIIGKGKISNNILFGKGEKVLMYPKGTKIARILIDTGLSKSWSQINGTFWKNWIIPFGFTDLNLNNISIWKGKGYGLHPHRLTIMNYEK